MYYMLIQGSRAVRFSTSLCRSFQKINPERRIRLFSTKSSSNIIDVVDVAIVGGGPVGLMFACMLASTPRERPLKVVLFDSSDLDKVRNWNPSSIFSNRVVSVTRENISALQKIDAWKNIDQQRTQPIEEMLVWDGISDAQINFDAREYHDESLSRFHNDDPSPWMSKMVEILNIQRGLLKTIDEKASTEIVSGTKVVSIDNDNVENGSWPIVTLDNGRKLRSRLLVGADGFNSPVKAFAGIGSSGWDYDSHAVVATLDIEPRSSCSTAYQLFLQTGPIAYLPLSDTAASLVWSTRPTLAKALKNLSSEELAGLINAAFTLSASSLSYLFTIAEQKDNGKKDIDLDLLKEIAWRRRVDAESVQGLPLASEIPAIVKNVQAGTVASFPLKMRHAEAYLGDPKHGIPSRTALIGDAAHTTHPLAGQGLNLGLRDSYSLGNTVLRSHELGLDIGMLTSLMDYPRSRYFRNHLMLSAVDKLQKINGTSFGPVVWARSSGLEILNELPFAKASIMKFAGSSGSSHDEDNSSIAKTIFGSLASVADVAISSTSVARAARDYVQKNIIR